MANKQVPRLVCFVNQSKYGRYRNVKRFARWLVELACRQNLPQAPEITGRLALAIEPLSPNLSLDSYTGFPLVRLLFFRLGKPP